MRKGVLLYNHRKGNEKNKLEETKMMNFEMSAANLYDGGWRAEDRDHLIEEYDLTEEEADEICEMLAEYED